jgi:ABC-2 type transport system permease protein
MRTVLHLFAKDLRVFWSDKVAVGLTFAVPMILITIFGLIFGGAGDGPSGVRVLVVDEAQSTASAQIIEALKEESGLDIRTVVADGETGEMRPMTRDDANSRLENNASTYRFALIFPEDFQKPTIGFRLLYWYNPQNAVEHQIVSGLLQKVFFTEALPILEQSMMESVETELGPDAIKTFQRSIAETVADTFGGSPEDVMAQFPEGGIFPSFSNPDSDESEASVEGEGAPSEDPFAFLLDLEEEQFFGEGINPAAQSVSGWAVMFLLFSLSGAAASLFDERNADLFHRLLAGPVTRLHILWSKYLFCGFLGLVQLAVLFCYGEVAFGIVDNVGQLPGLILVSVGAAAAATAFGMVLCALSRSPAQANGLGTLLILSMSALGGAMFPSFMLPAFIRDYIGPLTPVHWAMDGFLAVLWRDAGIVGILPHLGVLFGMALVVQLVASWGFKRGDLFR